MVVGSQQSVEQKVHFVREDLGTSVFMLEIDMWPCDISVRVKRRADLCTIHHILVWRYIGTMRLSG